MKFLIVEETYKSSDSNGTKYAAAAKSLQSCLTLCNPIDGRPPGSPVSGIPTIEKN